MIYKIFNKPVKNRISGKNDIYSLSFGNTSLPWRRNRVVEKLYGKDKNWDLVFSISAKSDDFRGDVLITTGIIRADDLEATLKGISDISLRDGFSKELKQSLIVLASHYINELYRNQNIVINEKNIISLGENLIAIKFENPTTGSHAKNITTLIFSRNYFLIIGLHIFTENKDEIKTAEVDFNEVLLSTKIAKTIM